MDAGSVESLFAGYPDVRLRLVSRSAHTSQVVTGFLMLARRRRIALTIEDAGHRREEYPHPHLVEAFVGGRRIAFDMLDGYNFDVVAAAAYIRGVDLYFKRSCSTFRNGVFPAEVRAKIRPLGFNYHVTCPENPINPAPVEIKSLRPVASASCGGGRVFYGGKVRMRSGTQGCGEEIEDPFSHAAVGGRAEPGDQCDANRYRAGAR